MQARTYAPEIGRFLSQDRYESAGADLALQSDPLTQNRYVFAGGNPVSMVEWDGHTVGEYFLGENSNNEGLQDAVANAADSATGTPTDIPDTLEVASTVANVVENVVAAVDAPHAPPRKAAAPVTGGDSVLDLFGDVVDAATGKASEEAAATFEQFKANVGIGEDNLDAVMGPDSAGTPDELIVGAADELIESCTGDDADVIGECGLAALGLAVTKRLGAPDGHSPSPAGGVTAVNGRMPINSRYAGETYDGPGWTQELQERYPSGVQFNDRGFPEFDSYAQARFRSDELTGDPRIDAAAANRERGFPRTPTGYTWHHVEDTQTLLLVPSDIHAAVRHTGGAAVLRAPGP